MRVELNKQANALDLNSDYSPFFSALVYNRFCFKLDFENAFDLRVPLRTAK